MSIMTKRTQIILLIIVFITVIATIFAATYKPKRSDSILRPIVRISAAMPLSGAEQHLGLAAQQALQKALNQIESDAYYKYEISYIDSALGSSLPQENIVLSWKYSPEPNVSINFNDAKQSKIKVHTSWKQSLDLLKKELMGKSIKKIGLIILAEGDYKTFAAKFMQEFRNTYQVEGAVFQKNQTDFSQIINQLINNDTDFYVIAGSPQESDDLFKSLKKYGIGNNQISSIYSIDLSANPALYESISYVGGQAGPYGGGYFASALLNLAEAFENNYQKEILPQTDDVISYLEDNKTDLKRRINLPPQIKQVSQGKIMPKSE